MIPFPYTKFGGERQNVYWGASNDSSFPTDTATLCATEVSVNNSSEVFIEFFTNANILYPVSNTAWVWYWIVFPIVNPAYPTYTLSDDFELLGWDTIIPVEDITGETTAEWAWENITFNGAAYRLLRVISKRLLTNTYFKA